MGALRIGKEKKHKSTSSAPKQSTVDEHGGFGGPNGDTFTEFVDVHSIADYEVNERYEQMLVSQLTNFINKFGMT